MSLHDRGRGYGPRECGSCRLWRPILEDERGPVGPCRLAVRTGDFPGTAPACERYLSVDAGGPLRATARAEPPPDAPSRGSPIRSPAGEPISEGRPRADAGSASAIDRRARARDHYQRS